MFITFPLNICPNVFCFDKIEAKDDEYFWSITFKKKNISFESILNWEL